MKPILQILLEAPITPDQANKFLLAKENQVSIYYDKKWVKVEPVRVVNIGGTDYLIAFEVADPNAKKPVQFELKKITNWNVLSKKSADRAKKEKQKKSVTTKKKPDIISDSIFNRRVVQFYYKGDKENAPGFRKKIKPLYYGTRNGVAYLRAYQDEGETYRGKLDKADSQYRPMPGFRLFRVDRITMSTYKPVGTDTFDKAPTGVNNKGKTVAYNGTDEFITDMDAKAEFPNLTGTGEGPKNISENKIISAILEAVRIF